MLTTVTKRQCSISVMSLAWPSIMYTQQLKQIKLTNLWPFTRTDSIRQALFGLWFNGQFTKQTATCVCLYMCLNAKQHAVFYMKAWLHSHSNDSVVSSLLNCDMTRIVMKRKSNGGCCTSTDYTHQYQQHSQTHKHKHRINWNWTIMNGTWLLDIVYTTGKLPNNQRQGTYTNEP